MPPRSRVVGRIPAASRSDLVLRVQLDDIEPPIWRALSVPSEFTLAQLHRTLQLVFGWQDCHLHAFEIGGRRFEAPDAEAEGESTAIRLSALSLAAGSSFVYRYDFGDDWEHVITVESVRPVSDPHAPRWPALLDGERACPPEDCGGPGGYDRLVAALSRPRTKAAQEYRNWFGPAYDPARFDRWQVANMLTLAAAYGAI